MRSAVARAFSFREGTTVVGHAPSRAAYDSVLEVLGSDRPPGRLLHAAAELPSGDIQIVDVWESSEASDAFGEVIRPAFAEVGLLDQMLAAGPPLAYETFDFDKA
jgi:hypothetical protein